MKFPENKREQIKWVKTTQNYFIGKYPELRFILNWIESLQSTVVTELHMAMLRNWPGIRDTDPEQLSENIWAYMNLVMANASNKSAFESAEAGNGFDAWRRIMEPIGPNSEERIQEMYRNTINPRPPKHAGEVLHDLTSWEGDLRSITGAAARSWMSRLSCSPCTG